MSYPGGSWWRKVAFQIGAQSTPGQSWAERVARFLGFSNIPGQSWPEKIARGRGQTRNQGSWAKRIVPTSPSTWNGPSEGQIYNSGVLAGGGSTNYIQTWGDEGTQNIGLWGDESGDLLNWGDGG